MNIPDTFFLPLKAHISDNALLFGSPLLRKYNVHKFSPLRVIVVHINLDEYDLLCGCIQSTL